MIDAGEQAILERLGGAQLGGLFCARDLAKSVYQAMEKARTALDKSTHSEEQSHSS